METLTLTLQYALAALDAQSSTQMTTAKKAVLRGIAAARLLENILLDESDSSSEDFSNVLHQGLSDIKKLSQKEFKALEKETADMLIAMNLMDEVPDLLACDMNYQTSGVSIRVYRSLEETYRSVVESVRAEILEEGSVTRECACLIWLFRESAVLHDLFSVGEQSTLLSRMAELSAKEEWLRILWEAEFHSGLEFSVLSFLRGKENLFKNPYLEGFNLNCPFFSRRQAIFIDCVVLGTTVQSRRLAALEYLSARGHYVEEVKHGTETLLKIDNAYYRIFPKTMQVGGGGVRVPIQGVQLVPFYQ